ncbi:L-aspartate oxidase [Caldanaerobius polysaccharolyticus]|uniref:L-aspartate oxidase n=1 Tax=Caldanaerobius polysaccharolyticus TaxID=44256 RepID=UPI000479581B|nr:L-aspartate oxidase [Caldanaerobius polysaccharolyticus]
MRRYLMDFKASTSNGARCDVLIIGSGIAGLYTALCLPEHLKIVIMCKGSIADSNSYLAQGGIAASIGDDDRDLHVRDTMVAGAFANDENVVRSLVEESEGAIESLMRLGVMFDRDQQGNLYRSLEGGHSVPRVLHVNGDATGKGIMDALIGQVRVRANIRVIENAFVVDIITHEGICRGVIAVDSKGVNVLWAQNVVMATGGIGQLYAKTTNCKVLTGDGIAMAIRAGAKTRDMEYIQFHPTAFYSGEYGEKLFLISEAVRGEGGILRNIHGERFMEKYDERMELAPRDIVSRAIFDQMKRTGSDFVYLDVTHLGEDFLKRRFPLIYNTCKSMGIDMAKDYIPITPVAHYFMGGIETDMWGRTGIKRLYAVGECACTGVHGANRLASNSLLEGVVFGRRVAQDIKNRSDACAGENVADVEFKSYKEYRPFDPSAMKGDLRELMLSKVGIVRNEKDLKEALDCVNERLEFLDRAALDTVDKMEVANMYLVARFIIEGALKNKRSVGSHYVQR